MNTGTEIITAPPDSAIKAEQGAVYISVRPWVRQYYEHGIDYGENGLTFPPYSCERQFVAAVLTSQQPGLNPEVSPEDETALKLDISSVISDPEFRRQQLIRTGNPSARKYYIQFSDRAFIGKVLEDAARKELSALIRQAAARGMKRGRFVNTMMAAAGIDLTENNRKFFLGLFDRIRQEKK